MVRAHRMSVGSTVSSAIQAILELQGVSTRDRSGNSISASLTNEDLQRLLTVFASSDTGGSGGGGRNVTLVSQDDDDDADYVDEEEEEEEDDDSGYFYGFGYPTSQRHWDRSDWWPEITEPQKEGLELLLGGEFGRVMHQMKTRDGNRNVARSILNRGAISRPTYREDIASVRIP